MIYLYLLELLKIVVWPLTVIFSICFFRKTFTYLVLSLEEFNFFGTRGRLKNVSDVIDERAKELNERLARQKEIDSLRESGDWKSATEQLFQELQIVKKERDDLRAELVSVRSENDVLSGWIIPKQKYIDSLMKSSYSSSPSPSASPDEK